MLGQWRGRWRGNQALQEWVLVVIMKCKTVAWWVPHFSSEEQKKVEHTIKQLFSTCYKNEGESFPDHFTTSDEIPACDFKPKMQ